jgi:hypothetical protein
MRNVRRPLTRFLCWFMALIVPASIAWSDTRLMLLTSQGVVKVNGVAVPESWTVFAGDKINTEHASSGTLVARGVQATLGSDSGAVYNNASLGLSHGQMVVSALPGMRAELGNLTVTPADAQTKFQMVRTQEHMQLAVLAGSLKVSDGTNQIMLVAGEMMQTDSGQDSAPPAAAGKGLGKKKIPGWVILMASSGAIAGTVVGITFANRGHHHVTPSTP